MHFRSMFPSYRNQSIDLLLIMPLTGFYMMGKLILTLQAPTPNTLKHTQTIRWQQPMNCLSVFDHSVGLALKGLNGLTKEDHIFACIKTNLLVHMLQGRSTFFQAEQSKRIFHRPAVM